MFEKTENKQKRGRGWPIFLKKNNLSVAKSLKMGSLHSSVDSPTRARLPFCGKKLQLLIKKVDKTNLVNHFMKGLLVG